MKPKCHISTFFRTLRAYNKADRIISQIFFAIIIVFVFKLIFFSGPTMYTEGYVGELVSLNPVFCDLNEVDRDVSRLIFSGLARYSPVQKAIVTDMADLKISEDKKTYSFTLKDHIKWHDGEVLDASDVYFTFHDVIQSEEFTNPLLKVNFEGVEVKKIDAKTITFTLKKPNAFFIANLTIGILPEHILGEVPVSELSSHKFNKEPIGTGPYRVVEKIKSYSNGQTAVILKRFNDYYGEKSSLKAIKILTYSSTEHMVDDRKNLNVIAKVTGSDADPIRNDENFKLIPYRLPQYTAVFLNMSSKLLKDQKLRLGILKAIDKEKLVTVLNDTEIIDTPMLELDKKNWIYDASSEQANGALYDAGYKYENDGDKFRRDPDGEVLKLNMVARLYPQGSRLHEEHKALVDFLIKSWGHVGVDVSVNWLSLDIFNEAIRARDYDLLLAGQSLGYNLDTFAYWHSSQTGENGLNLSNYKTFKVDTLLEDLRDTFDNGNKQKKLAELATAMADDVPAIFLYRPIYYFVSDGDVGSVSAGDLSYPGDRYLMISEWE